jgi:TPR repeat protein
MSLLNLTADSDSDESVDWTYEPEPSPPYRYYVGAVLAIVILVLGYMAWRGTQAGQNSHEVSAPPPAAASDTAAEPAPTPAPAKTAAEPPAQAPASDTSAHAAPATDAPKNPPETNPSRDQVSESTPSSAAASPSRAAAQPKIPAQHPPSPAAAQPAAGNGGEELDIAERYLNGAVGQRRDTSEAAKWLWKSVAKHNGQATVLLSDLYLKGQGVPKNCDQARVLLYSAARKGVAGAGERLRNLPAFGCD